VSISSSSYYQYIYITKNPKSSAPIEIKELVAMLKRTDEKSFEGALEDVL
jgi:hypothetical protein